MLNGKTELSFRMGMGQPEGLSRADWGEDRGTRHRGSQEASSAYAKAFGIEKYEPQTRFACQVERREKTEGNLLTD